MVRIEIRSGSESGRLDERVGGGGGVEVWNELRMEHWSMSRPDMIDHQEKRGGLRELLLMLLDFRASNMKASHLLNKSYEIWCGGRLKFAQGSAVVTRGLCP